ncbi:MAG: MMPL family transporter, partial [Acidimicrobiia bacterium]|nr:MMPL family transporter [Acidimicrobiia bacterium]
LKSDQILSTILPISMISFGIDSAFHGIGRVREERAKGVFGRRAFVIGLGSVLGALALAAASDAVAFLSNTTAGIESVVQFGFAAALATVVAFLLLGIVTPLILSVVEGEKETRSVTRFGRVGDLILSLIAAGLATGTVAVLLFLSTEIGLGMLLGYLVLAIVLPWLLWRRGNGVVQVRSAPSRWPKRLGGLVASVASRPMVTLLVAAVVTGAAFWSALQLSVTFDVNDFFSSDSDFVVALDKTTHYLGDQGGEPATVYIETDLTSPEALEAIQLFTVRIAASPDNPLARDGDGVVRVDSGVLELVDDFDDNILLDTSKSLLIFYDEALAVGIDDGRGTSWSANDVGTVLWRSEDASQYATVLRYQIPDTRDQTNVVRTRETLEPAAKELERALRKIDEESSVVVSGSAIYRDDQLAGIRRSMLLALPLAVFACLIIAMGFMRSIRYGIVSVVPILLVVTWLYGLMHQAGFAVNVVTSIIGAVSVGIGIDFSTHFTMRFLEERRAGAGTDVALATAGTGTGSALAGSAMTSVAGFGILAFAPMPMFATYGLLTAIMIVLALIASLFVLPSLLAVVTGDGQEPSSGSLVADLRLDGTTPLRLGLSRDLSDGVVDHVLEVCEGQLRDGGLSIGTVPAADVVEQIRDGDFDVALMTYWPGGAVPETKGLEVVPLAKEDLVAVGGSATHPDIASLKDIARKLVISGPHHESELGIESILRTETKTPFLAHSVAQVRAGLRIAAITGGTMILPRSMAKHAGILPVRLLDPPAVIQTVLLVSHDRAGDPNVFVLAAGMSNALRSDDRMDTAALRNS